MAGAGGASQADEQTHAERRQVRVTYRELINTATEQRDEFFRDTGKLVKTLDMVADLHTNVHKPREQAVDSELMVVLAGYGLQMAKALTPGASSVSAADFLARLQTTYAAGWGDVSADTPADPAGFDWRELGRAVGKHFRWAPSCAPHMLGPLDTAVKERKAAQRRAKDVKAAVQRPDEVDDAGETGTAQAETERAMKVMRKVVSRHPGGVDALRLVYNGACFAQTVENVFTLSFLVKDGRVKLRRAPGGAGVLVDLAASAPAPADFATGEAAALQFVLRLDVADWEEVRSRMPAEPLMPHRPPHAEAAAARASRAGMTPGLPPGREARAGGGGKDDTTPLLEEGGEAAPARGKRAAAAAGKAKRKALVESEGEEEEADGEEEEEEAPAPVSKRRRGAA